MNFFCLTGRVADAPKTGTSAKGVYWTRCRFRHDHDKREEWAEITVIGFGRAASLLADHQDRTLCIVGRVKTETFKGKDGTDGKRTQHVIESAYVYPESEGRSANHPHHGVQPGDTPPPALPMPTDDEPPF